MFTYIFVALSLNHMSFSQISNENDKISAKDSRLELAGEIHDDNVNAEYEQDHEGMVKDDGITNKLNKFHAEEVGLKQDEINKYWPLGIIEYHVDNESYDHILEQRLRSAMDIIESTSCVQFRSRKSKPVDSKGAWLHFTNPTMERECIHKPEIRPGGEVIVVLGLDCLKRRNILHSLMHAIGIPDEVTHPQRDRYIRINWENIQPQYHHLFAINTFDAIDAKTTLEYDPMSIMHFHDRAFSLNGKATIAPLISGLQIKPSDKLSQLDKMNLRLIFEHECNRRKVENIIDTCKNVVLKDEGNDGFKEAESEIQETSTKNEVIPEIPPDQCKYE